MVGAGMTWQMAVWIATLGAALAWCAWRGMRRE